MKIGQTVKYHNYPIYKHNKLTFTPSRVMKFSNDWEDICHQDEWENVSS